MRTFFGTFALIFLMVGVLVAGEPGYRTRHAYGQVYYPQTHAYAQSYYQQPTHYDAGYRHRHRNVVQIESVAQINPAYVSSYGGSTAYDSTTQDEIKAILNTLAARVDQLAAIAAQSQTGGSVVVQPSTPVVPGKLGTTPSAGAPAVIVVPQGGPAAPITVVPAAKPGGAAVGLAVANGHCAACHQAGRLQPQDQRFTLLDTKGNLVTLTDKQKIAVSNKTRTFQMPPPNNTAGATPLTDLEYHALGDLIGF